MKLRYILPLVLLASTAYADERPMSTERPSRTDSAMTVDVGQYQVESSLYNRTDNKWDIGAGTDLRFGINHSSEFQLILNPYSDAGDSKNRGIGDTMLRYKYNFWGNDGGATALAIMPYLNIPTAQHYPGHHVAEGGLGLPFSWNISDGLSVGAMTRYDVLPGGQFGLADSLVVYRGIAKRFTVYGELYTYKTADWANTADFGVVYAVSDHFDVDAGMDFGVTAAAPRHQVFAGFSYLF